MKFADIPGHENIKQRLREMVDAERIPHAMIFEGPAGSSKYMLARAFVQYIHCTARTNGDSCGKCQSCLQHESFNHIDTFMSFPVIKKGTTATSQDYIKDFCKFVEENPFMDFQTWQQSLNNSNARPMIYVEEAATLIKKLGFAPRQSKFKTALIWLPERMQESAANKLLKIVEEPYKDTIIIMISNESSKVLPTIYSRTQRINVHRYDDSETQEILKNIYPELSDQVLSDIAHLCHGNINDALNIISQSEEREKFLSFFQELMRKAFQRKILDLRQWSLDVAALGREGQMRFYEYCSRMLRENFIYNLKQPELNFMTYDEERFSVNFSRFVNHRNVLELMNVFDQARNDISANTSAKIVNFDVAIRCILLIKK